MALVGLPIRVMQNPKKPLDLFVKELIIKRIEGIENDTEES